MKQPLAGYSVPWVCTICFCAAAGSFFPGCFEIPSPPSLADAPTEPEAGTPSPQTRSPLQQQTVVAGDLVILRGTEISENSDAGATYVWLQLSGPSVELHNRFAPFSHFIAPQVDDEAVLGFQFIRIEGGDDEVQSFLVRVMDAGQSRGSSLCEGVICDSRTPCNPSTGTCGAGQGMCDDVVCPDGQTCDASTGECVATRPCAGVICGPNQHCNAATNVCEPICPNIVCPQGQRPDPLTCTCNETQRCEAVTCATGKRCNPETGACEAIDPCNAVVCAAGKTCDPASGECVVVNLCSNVSCPVGFICESAAGNCIAAGGCSDPPAQSVFVVTGSAVGALKYSLSPDYWVEFNLSVDAETFSTDLVAVQHAGTDDVWGTADDAVVAASARLDCCQRISVSLAAQGGALLGGRRYRVSVSPGCLRVTNGAGAKLGLDGEFSGTFPSGDGRFGGPFVQEFLGVAPGSYSGEVVCDEETRDILGRVTRETKHYDNTIVVDPTGVLVLDGHPIRVAETMSPEVPGFEFEMEVTSVTPESSGLHVTYDVSGTKDGYLFDGPQEETYTFLADGTIRLAGTSTFGVHGFGGGVVANFTRTCAGTLGP